MVTVSTEENMRSIVSEPVPYMQRCCKKTCGIMLLTRVYNARIIFSLRTTPMKSLPNTIVVRADMVNAFLALPPFTPTAGEVKVTKTRILVRRLTITSQVAFTTNPPTSPTRLTTILVFFPWVFSLFSSIVWLLFQLFLPFMLLFLLYFLMLNKW